MTGIEFRRAFLVMLCLGGASACASLDSTPASDREIRCTYESVPSDDGNARRVSVMLMANRVSAVDGASPGEPNRHLTESKWECRGNQIVLALGGPRPQRLVFEYEAGRLTAKDWDPLSWEKADPGTLLKR